MIYCPLNRGIRCRSNEGVQQFNCTDIPPADGGSRYGGFSRGERDGGDRDRDGGRYGGFSRDRDGGDRYERREQEAPKERPKLALAPRSKDKEEGGETATQSSIFGGAKPVDTVKKEKEMEEKLLKEKKEKELALEEARKNKPSAASIFGGAKPVDTSQREKEIESKLEKMTVKKETDVSEDKEKDLAWRRKDDSDAPKSGAYRPPGRRDDSERRSDRGYDDRRDRGYDDRRDRGYDDRRERDRGYDDRRDRDRGYDDRRDTRGYDDRRDNRGSNDRRDDRYDRRDRRSEPDSRDDRDRRDDRV